MVLMTVVMMMVTMTVVIVMVVVPVFGIRRSSKGLLVEPPRNVDRLLHRIDQGSIEQPPRVDLAMRVASRRKSACRNR